VWRVIDVGGSGYFLHTHHNSLIIEKDGSKTEVPFQDIHSIICHGVGFRYSDAFFKACLHNKIPVTFCDETHLPLGMLLPMYQHTDAAKRMEAQLQASLPRKKQAWQQIIKAKLHFQGDLLESLGLSNGARRLFVLAKNVLSGDPTNNEAQGAKIYFEALMGTTFFRSDQTNAINAKLDYGYSILRSAVARAVVDVGLLPSQGVFHSNRINPFCLIDDLMEPYRPMVDSLVLSIGAKYGIEPTLIPDEKRLLMNLTAATVTTGENKMELTNALRIYVMSYLNFLTREQNAIEFPTPEYAWTI